MEKTKKYNPRFKAEFSMGLSDYERFEEILKALDTLAVRVRPPHIDLNCITPYYSSLKQLYINLRAIMSDEIKDRFDKFFKDLQEQMISFSNSISQSMLRKGINIPTKLLTDLEKAHINLLEIKQFSGLGINIQKVEGWKEKMKRALSI